MQAVGPPDVQRTRIRLAVDQAGFGEGAEHGEPSCALGVHGRRRRIRVQPALCLITVVDAILIPGQGGFQQRLDLSVAISADGLRVDQPPAVAVAQYVPSVQIAVDDHVVSAIGQQRAEFGLQRGLVGESGHPVQRSTGDGEPLEGDRRRPGSMQAGAIAPQTVSISSVPMRASSSMSPGRRRSSSIV